ncbi:MAG TPA: 50S ribosomal protein L19e [Candidatus Diapherotrites archaeon]|uniref:Large ribosomal subunit protein eL19 n=2 Tax=Candidatus Iainarchaeum sp. TaxID=3101447 RepID=A0A7J4JHD0_9ARCH|nr:50S ribosomal protein L19e [Candidatus Diapherotrites archaeon]
MGMQANKLRRLAASVLKCGKSKIWISPDALDRLKEAMTKEDVRLLIKDGVIRWKKESGHSRGRARVLQAKKRKGRKSGEGKRSGTKKARVKQRLRWIANVRAQRAVLRKLRAEDQLKGEFTYAKLYNMVKGGYFKGKKQLEQLATGGGK